MEKILELRDENVGFETTSNVNYKTRTASRAVLKKGNLIALLNVSKHCYYKLPGGGVEKGETLEDALQREVWEETGCTFKTLKEIGEIVEHRSKLKIVQTSHCFLAEVVSDGEPHFTQKEINDGFKLEWVMLEKAIELLKKSTPDTYDGKFIVKRDLKFLCEVSPHISRFQL